MRGGEVVEPREEPARGEVRWREHVERAGLAAMAHRIHRCLNAGEPLAHLRQQELSLRCQLESPREPAEERHAEDRLEELHLVAHGARGHVQLGGGVLEAQVARGGLEGAQRMQRGKAFGSLAHDTNSLRHRRKTARLLQCNIATIFCPRIFHKEIPWISRTRIPISRPSKTTFGVRAWSAVWPTRRFSPTRWSARGGASGTWVHASRLEWAENVHRPPSALPPRDARPRRAPREGAHRPGCLSPHAERPGRGLQPEVEPRSHPARE